MSYIHVITLSDTVQILKDPWNIDCYLTLEGLKLAAAIGAPRTVKVTSQRPPRRRKNEPGLSSPHEYKPPSFRDEYSLTYHITRLLSVVIC